MNVDLPAAAAFMAGHARVLDRRRFQLLVGGADPDAVLAALDAYRNPDGGYGWALEPDLRSAESQPVGAQHAFEVLEDVAPAAAPQSVALCDWLASVTRPDGGLPFALAITDPAGCAPWWTRADPGSSSLQITAAVAAAAHRVAVHDPAVAGHAWLATATEYCLAAIGAVTDAPHAMELAFAVRFLDAVHDTRPEAAALLARLGRHLPADGLLHVGGGTEEESMRPLDFTPVPDRPARALFSPPVVDADLRRLADGQQDDGGWSVDWAISSPAGALDWRGHATVRAVSILLSNFRI
jgi:hypothetical protein